MTGKDLVPTAPVRKNLGGRPSKYTEELAAEICDRIAEGETLIEICRDDHMPWARTVRMWAIDDREGFHSRYVRARQMQVEHEVEEAKLILDNQQVGEVVTTKAVWDAEKGEFVQQVEVKRSDMLAHRQAQADIRKWRASKIAWRLYGSPEKAANPEDTPAEEPPRILGGLPEGEP